MTTEVKRTVGDLLEDITERLLTGMVQADGARQLAERAANLLNGQPAPRSLYAALIQCGLDTNEVECIFEACAPETAPIREDKPLTSQRRFCRTAARRRWNSRAEDCVKSH